jgi:GDP-L-fucose synthase
MKLLVTGSKGMLGSAIGRLASEMSGIDLVLWDRNTVDLLDTTATFERMSETKPDFVIHAAAKVGGIHANIAHPVEYLADNLRLDSNVLLAALKNNVENLVYVGSSCMYPRDYRQPLVESDVLAAPLEPTNEGYALAKISGSRLATYISLEHAKNYRTIIPSNLYGPGDNFDEKSSHLVAACLRKSHETKEIGASEIEIWGDGEARREFTYIDDVASWLLGHLNGISAWPSLLNLGLGVDYSVNEFYEIAMKTVGCDAALRHNKSKPTGMRQKLMDSSIARNSFGWNPKTSIENGMKLAYQDFLKRDA